MKRLKILVSNDDGFRAKGIRMLAEAARELGDVTVVAPHDARSGASGAITSTTPISLKLREKIDGFALYSSTGTPTDCVKLALHTLFADERPDIVLSGINHGRNDGICVIYSGTVGAAMEAAVAGIPALAISVDDHGLEPDLSYAIPYAISIAKSVLKTGLPTGTLLNLNIPKGRKPLGLKYCPQTNGRFVEEYLSYKSPSGEDFFWMTGHQVSKDVEQEGDLEALEAGYATLTPILTNLTNYDFLNELRSSPD